MKIKVRTQAEFDKAVSEGAIAICIGDGHFEARDNSFIEARDNSFVKAYENSSVKAYENSSVKAWGNSSVKAYENSSVEVWENSSVEARGNSSVEAYGNSFVKAYGNSFVEARRNSFVKARGNSSVEAWGNSFVEARENSSVKAYENSSVEAWRNSSVEARGNSSVKARENSFVKAYENSSVEARGNSSVKAWGNVFVRLFNCLKIEISISVIVMRHNKKIKVDGGTVIDGLKPQNAREWCDFYGIKINNGKAVLFKAVDINYDSYRGFSYSPRTIPVAPDWDGGKKECGNGLHFSSHPRIANSFFNSAVRFLACPINLSDIAVHPDGKYPKKIKARGCCDPIWEVDINGKEIK